MEHLPNLVVDHQSHYAVASEVAEGVEVAVLEAVAVVVIGVAEVTALHPWVDWEARGCLALYCVEAFEVGPNLSQLQEEEVVDPMGVWVVPVVGLPAVVVGPDVLEVACFPEELEVGLQV